MLTGAPELLGGLDPASLFAPVADEKKIGLAVSGGPDSLALMALYAAWRDTGTAPQAIVYTLNHGLRAEAAGEAELVRRQASGRGFEVRVLKWSGEKPDTGISAAARTARYRLIGAAMAEDGAKVLLTAHHRDDQAETVLMRLAHGSGARGLGGMRAFSEVEGVRVFRPLLGVAKDRLVAIVAAHKIEAAEDPTNSDLDYERARWRAMRPDLERMGLTAERLARFALRMQRLDALAADAARAAWQSNVRVDDFGVVHMAARLFGGVADEAAVRVLWRVLGQAGGGQQGDLSAVETLYEKLAEGVTGSLTLMGAVIVPGADEVLIYRETGRKGLPEGRVEPGGNMVWDGRFGIEASCAATIVPASAMTRRSFSELTGGVPEVPIAALRAAPLVQDEAERVLALGTRVFDPRVSVRHVALT